MGTKITRVVVELHGLEIPMDAAMERTAKDGMGALALAASHMAALMTELLDERARRQLDQETIARLAREVVELKLRNEDLERQALARRNDLTAQN